MPGGWDDGGWGGVDLKGTSSSPDFVVVVRFLRLFILVFFPATRLERSGVDLISQVISRERDERRVGGRVGGREGGREGK